MAMPYRVRLLGWLLLAALVPVAGPAASAELDKADVRVLIDISGSMRQNDPNNLRRPALRMLAELLQPGTRAGVWTFARWVNNLVPVGEVDRAWKKRTQALSKKIGSPGQFTNIEEVIDKASLDWNGEMPTHARHLVLLTDGMVDVSKQTDENTASRNRIIQELLPRLLADNIKVHTIALSARADHELMERLAGETGGWYQQVEHAADLQRVFLRMFEKVGTPDTVPLEDNRFIVDGAINEATVLAFSKPGAAPVSLRSPSGEQFSDSDLPSGIAWFRDEGYDMITIASPEKGEWVLEADLDPDNRVMIVTDLKLQTSEIPTHIAVGEEIDVGANLNNRGEVVTRQAFLRLLQVNADASGIDGLGLQPMQDNGEPPDQTAADGHYTMRFGVPGQAEQVELVVTVESPTFMREKRFRLVAHEPVDAYVDDSADGPILQIDLQKAVMESGATVTAWQETISGEPMPLAVQPKEADTWVAPMLDTVSPSYIKVTGTTRLGIPVERTVGPIMPAGVAPPVVAPPAPEPSVEEASAEEVEAAPEEQTETPPEETASDWTIPAVIFGVFNLLLIVGGTAWFLLRRRTAKQSDDQLDDLINEADGMANVAMTEDAA